MLRRSWSLPPNYGLRRRDASPADHRRKQRSQSFSGREMIKELRMLDMSNTTKEDRQEPDEGGRLLLELMAEKAARRKEEAKIMKEELSSALTKLDKIMSKAKNLKKLEDLDEAKSGDDKQDTCIDAKKKQEEAQKERTEMHQMIDELTREEIHRTSYLGATTQEEDAETEMNSN